MISALKNAFLSWIIEGKNSKGDEIIAWCFASSFMILVFIGFCFLAWFFPTIALFTFIIVFLPMITLICFKYSNAKIDEKLEEIYQYNHRNRW